MEKKWKAINYCGEWNYDPRGELLARMRRAEDANDSYVSIPVELARACGELHECAAITVMKVDYGPGEITLVCRKPQGHLYNHFNGSISWK